MATLLTVKLTKGDSPNWGFRLQGGKDFGTPLVIQKVIVGSPAERAGLIAGDSVIKVNQTDVFNLRHKDAQDVLLRAGNSFDMTIQRGGSTWKPSVVPTGILSTPSPTINNISPVTRTSLAAKPSENIGAIGTGHNLSAKPFANGTLNGGPKVVNNQYNSPLKLYSEESIAETLSAQTEVLSTGALGVNFKKNEKNYDASKSAVLSLLKEEENSPKSPDHTVTSPYYASHSHAIGSRSRSPWIDTHHYNNHDHYSRSNSRQSTSTLSPRSPNTNDDQVTICTFCDRVIVGVFVRIKDKNLHVECFKCSTCGTSLKNVGYYNINNKLYCDIHAKLAARNNAPAPNLVPITVPPGGKAPANAISAALASHPYHTPAPLSPKINSYQNNDETDETKQIIDLTLTKEPVTPIRFSNINNITPKPFGEYVSKSPLSGPKPFSSVPGPLSPSSNFNSLPRSGAPLSPVAPAPAYSPVASTVHSLSNIVWPPVSEEPEFPTACPIFYPPPSQVTVKPRTRKDSRDSQSSELEQINDMEEYQFRQYYECAAGRKSATECAETISESVGRQILVENIMRDRPKSPPQQKTRIPRAEEEREKIEKCESLHKEHEHYTKEPVHEPKPDTTKSGYPEEEAKDHQRAEAKCKITNPVPKQWESQMLQALKITSDESDSYSSTTRMCSTEKLNVMEKNSRETIFSDIPIKKPSTALGSALSVAPSEPFNPVKPSGLEPIPLPEETVPYFPPEDLFTIPINTENQEKEKPFKKKKDPNLEKILEELPKPQERLTMRSALTTAPDRPFTPVSIQGDPQSVPSPVQIYKASIQTTPVLYETAPSLVETISTEDSKTETSEQSETKTTKTIQKKVKEERPTALPITVKIENQDDTPSPESLPLFQGFTCSFKNKSDVSQFDIQISTTPPTRDKKHRRTPVVKVEAEPPGEIKVTELTEETSSTETCSKKEMQSTEKKEFRQSEKPVGNVIYKKPSQMVSLHKPDALPQYQVSMRENAEADLIMMAKMEKSKMKKEQQKQQQLQEGQQKAASQQKCQLTHGKTTHQERAAAIEKSKAESELRVRDYQESRNVTQISQEQSAQQRREMETQRIAPTICPVITVQNGNHKSDNMFTPVPDSRPLHPTPRPLTPSMINKPPPIIPPYQANLVAQRYGPPSVNLLDPKSPAVSRSPSPCPEHQKSSDLLGSRSSNLRPKSPAQGPPPNPLRKEHIPTRRDFKVEEAKEYVSAFIPQYREKVDVCVEQPGRDSRNEQRNLRYSADVKTVREDAPMVTYQAERRMEEVSATSGRQQEEIKLQEYRSKQTDDRSREETRSHVSGSTESTTKVSEKSHSEKEEESKKMENKSIERSADGSVQIQRTRRVMEEFEHSQQSKEITIEKNMRSSNQEGFRNVREVDDGAQNMTGLHITAPNPIRSRFLESNQEAAPPKMTTVCQKVGKDAPYKKVESTKPPEKLPPSFPKFDATTLPKPKPIPELRDVTIEEKKTPPKPTKHVEPPGSSKSNQKLTPSVPPSNVGATGGRQSGAVGVAPKRGRGVLNAAQLGGGRIPLCGQCHGQIRGPFITALGKIWCPNHFICATPSCRRPLQDLGFVEEQGQLYCEYCFEQYLAPVCSKCGSKVKGDCLKAIGKSFHPECFNCVHCGKLFGNSPFFLEDGSPYCETDWNEFFTTKCFACGFPVEAGDRWVEALNNNYHSQCFNCTMCKKNLEGQSFFAKGGRPYCKTHAR
ncbi:PDZ and LIM domain protein Zasp isoform X2 [Coccinella septempunctata]|uniref:PDZ and LIM domain protein Zasp isoform X2 n=1 Tax=Coccinella septempunctata TaxID=41139 RepID=UPI001D084313|nr:PDZ and LIM domain protein Zasp isoform X2 [Coccinella septempunctata]